jgi:type IV secretory pathway TraG/TraD family ATPase VirD4
MTGMCKPFQDKTKAYQGQLLQDTLPEFEETSEINMYGKEVDGIIPVVPLTNKILSQHLFVVGSSGFGKTNFLKGVSRCIRQSLTGDDLMIIFDPKGDYLDLFKPCDIVIDNVWREESDEMSYWNLFREIDRGASISLMETEVLEVANTLFDQQIQTNRTQPFFPRAARDIFAGILTYFLYHQDHKDVRWDNAGLSRFFFEKSIREIKDILASEPTLKSLVSYIDNTDNQALGVMSELQQVVRSLFIGNFREKGQLSIRELVREKGGRVVFIEYDLMYGHLLAPIYRLMFDLALKEALGRQQQSGNVYFLLDEFRLMPNSPHLELAANFGRSKGVKMIIALQAVEQLYGMYSSAEGESLLAGFSSCIAFNLNDSTSRAFMSNRLGKNQKLVTHKDNHGVVVERIEPGFVAEDWDFYSLPQGWAIIKLPDQAPFRFHFAKDQSD